MGKQAIPEAFEIEPDDRHSSEKDSKKLLSSKSTSNQACCRFCCRCCTWNCICKLFCVIIILVGIGLVAAGTVANKMASPYIDEVLKGSALTCSTSDDNFAGFESNFDSKIPQYQKLTLYDVTNAAAFYDGQKATLEEIACTFVQELSCEDCFENRTTTNYSPGYAKVMTKTVNEGMLFLKIAGCSKTQITAIGGLDPTDPLKHPIDFNKDIGGPDNAEKACCVPDVAILTPPLFLTPADTADAMEAYCALPLSGCTTSFPEYKTCSTIVAETKSFISSMNRADGGVRTSAGDYSELMITKTASELALGYPFALGGYLAGTIIGENLTPDQAAVAFQTTDIGGTTLNEMSRDVAKVCGANIGLKDSHSEASCTCSSSCEADCSAFGTDTCNSFCDASGGGSCGCSPSCTFVCNTLADDTCESSCSVSGTPADDFNLQYEYTGFAPEQAASEMEGEGSNQFAYLSGISCAVGNVGLDAAAECVNGNKNCKCSDGTPITSPMQSCCISEPVDMMGKGCLAWVPGWITPEKNRWSLQNVTHWEEAPSFKIGSGCNNDNKETTTNSEDTFDTVLEYNGEATGAIWFNGAKLPSPTEVQTFMGLTDPTETTYNVDTFLAMGGKFNEAGGKKSPALRPEGLDTRVWGTDTFNDGGEPQDSKKLGSQFGIFLSYLFRAISVVYEGKIDLKGLALQRYRLNTEVLSSTEEHKLEGIGIVSGTSVQTFQFAAPVVVSLPNFLEAGPLLTQDGDVEVFKIYDYGELTKLATRELMTEASVKVLRDEYETYLDIEPSTGKAMNGHSRLMGSVYTYDCPVDASRTINDDTYNACFLFFQVGLTDFPKVGEMSAVTGNANGWTITNGDEGVVGGFPRSVANIFTPKLKPEKFLPNFWVDQTATIDDESAKKLVEYGELLGKVERYAKKAVLGGILVALAGISLLVIACSCWKGLKDKELEEGEQKEFV